MNYPIWDLQASGLMIAFIAIVHVFVSHFAVGGGLFLVVTEWKARKEGNEKLLGYVRHHSRFFILLTLVFGAVTGVGIWFTIGLVHPSATSSLINTFVWGWAIEWTFFLTEIAAALVYYYGWDRLSAKLHMVVGWIYFVAAWMSLVVINGILSYMLTPGRWPETHGFWDGFFNETYWPSLVIRTLGAMGLAGVYALFTASFSKDAELKATLSRYAALAWVLPMAIGLPVCLFWYFAAASTAGIPVAEIFAASGDGLAAILGSAFATAATSGYPVAQTALRVALTGIVATILLTFALFLFRRDRFGRLGTGLLMVAAFLAVGGSEWVREDLRKPYVLGSYMFVHGIRLPAPEGSPESAGEVPDKFRIDEATRAGILKTANWMRLPEGFELASDLSIEDEARAGEEVFFLLCRGCHTVDGYLAIRPLVEGKSSTAIESVIDRLALPKRADGGAASWSEPDIRLATWRGRRMPPFVGTEAEERALAVYLAILGGGDVARPVGIAAHPGLHVFEDHCAACHAADADWPIESRLSGRSEDALYDAIGRLEEVNEMMPPFDASDQDRRDLAAYLAGLGASGGADPGATIFEDNCAACHSAEADWPIEGVVARKSEAELFEALGELEKRNDMMPPFEGTDEERAALARHLAAIAAGGAK